MLQQRRWLRVWLPIALYTLIALFMTWPLVTQLSTHMPGLALSESDSIEHVRMIWWAKYALQHGLNPFYQSMFGYPDGFFSAVQWAQPLVYWPPTLISFVWDNPIATFNLWTLVTLVLNGLAAYWLCLDLLQNGGVATPSIKMPGYQPEKPTEGAKDKGDSSQDRPLQYVRAAALLGGTVFMTFPTLQGHLIAAHINIDSLYGLPILLLSLSRILSGRGTVRTALLGAIGIAVLLLTNSTSLVFLLFPLMFFGGGYLLIAQRRALRAITRRQIAHLLIVFGGASLISLPFYLPLFLDALNPARAAYLQLQGVGWTLFSTDLLAFAAISPFTPWTKPFAPPFSYTILNTNFIEGSAYLGVIACVLSVIALIKRRGAMGVWLVLLLGGMLFSLGPMLKWLEQPVVYTLGLDRSNIVLPWAAFQNLPLLNIIRTPGRFNFLTELAISVLAAYGMREVLVRVSRPTPRLVLSGVMIVIVVLEYQARFPFPTYSLPQWGYFQTLADRSEVRAVFDVPYDTTYKEGLYEQIAHQKPIMAGYYSRLTPVDPAKLMLLSEIARGQAWQASANTARFPGDPLQSDDARSILKDNGIDVLVYRLDRLDKIEQPATLNWATQTFGPPTYQDERIAVFEVPLPAQRSDKVVLTHAAQYWWPYNPPNDGWWPDQRSTAESLWLRGGARLVAYTPVSTLQQFTFNLSPLLHPYTLQLSVDGYPFRTWEVRPPTTRIEFWLPLKPSFHALQFSVSEGCTLIPVVPACLLESNKQPLSSPACQLKPYEQNVCASMQIASLQSAPQDLAYQTVNISLDSGMMLRGFRVPDQAKSGSTIPVETDWAASQKLPGDYHLFIHILSQDGKLVAQYDAIPGGGKFSTTKWTADQQWDEIASVTLPADLAPGTYDVYVGWYAYPSLARLAVHGEGKHASDKLVFLKSITVKQD